jgi:hypothetical protein
VKVIRAGRLIDVTGAAVQHAVSVFCEDGRIVGVERDGAAGWIAAPCMWTELLLPLPPRVDGRPVCATLGTARPSVKALASATAKLGKGSPPQIDGASTVLHRP